MNPERNFRKNLNSELDFSLKEKMVFNALIKLKMAYTASKIAREAGLPRVTTIRILGKLENRKLAEKIFRKTKMGKRPVWKIKTKLSRETFEGKILGVEDPEYRAGE